LRHFVGINVTIPPFATRAHWPMPF
jgi:hypothetical protein